MNISIKLCIIENEIIEHVNNFTKNVKEFFKQQKRIDATLKLQILENKIDILLDNIVSIKNDVLHPGIILSDETEEYKITIEQLENARTGIVSTNQNKLYLTIKIPSKYETVPYHILYPIPNNKYEEIEETPQQFVTLNNIKYEYENRIIYKKELKPLKTCTDKICRKVVNKNTEIDNINDNILICKNLNNEEIIHNCDVRKLKLTGNYMIIINNCSLMIRNNKYKQESKQFVDTEIFEILPEFNSNKLEQIKINETENIKEVNEISFHRNVSVGINVVLIVIIVIILIVLIMSLKRRTNVVNIKNETQTLQSKSALNEGGVMLPEYIQIPNFAIPSNSPYLY